MRELINWKDVTIAVWRPHSLKKKKSDLGWLLAFPKQAKIFWPLPIPPGNGRGRKIHWQWRKLVRNLIYFKTISKPGAGDCSKELTRPSFWSAQTQWCSKSILNPCTHVPVRKALPPRLSTQAVTEKACYRATSLARGPPHCPYGRVSQVEICICLPTGNQVCIFP